MKVFMISSADADDPYGSTARPMHLAAGLAQAGLKIIHVCKKAGQNSTRLDCLSTVSLRATSKAGRLRSLLGTAGRFEPDLIYSHQMEAASYGIILRALLRRPHVYDPHGSIALELPTLDFLSPASRVMRVQNEKIVLRFSDKTIVPSSELAAYIKNKYSVSPGRLALVKNGVDTVLFRPAFPDMRLKASLGLPAEAKLVVFTLPRIATFPGNEMALKCFFQIIPLVEKKIRGVKFLILGGGRRIEPPSPNVVYSGFVDDLPGHLNLADVCVAPYPPEAVCGGTRNKICEYLSCGKPVVATREGMRGFDDAIPGFHFLLAGVVDDFADKIVECLLNPALSEQLGLRARRLAKSYDWTHLARHLVRVLREVGESKVAGNRSH